MYAEAFFGVGQDLVLAPGVRHASGKGDHPAQGLDLVRQRPLSIDRQSRVSGLQITKEMAAVFRNDLNGIGRQQLIVAERGGDGASMRIIFAAGLDVVVAVAGCFEAVNAHDLISGQPGRQRHAGVSALELVVALRPLRRELEFAFRRGKKVGDHRHIDPLRRRFGLERIARLWWPAIDRWLNEHVVVDRKRFAVRAFGVAQLPLRRDLAPIRARGGGVSVVELGIGFQCGAILRHRGAGICRSAEQLTALRSGWRRSKHRRCNDQAGSEQIKRFAIYRTDPHPVAALSKLAPFQPLLHSQFYDATRAASLPPSCINVAETR